MKEAILKQAKMAGQDVYFKFLRKRNYTQNITLSILIKLYEWSILYNNHSQKYFTISENSLGIYDQKNYCVCFFSEIAMLNDTYCNLQRF